MSKKLIGNGLWESSRMMLPEHVDQINIQMRELDKRQRIEIDEQEWDVILSEMRRAISDRIPVTISLYDPYEDLEVSGLIERVDPLKKRFRVDGEWFMIADILSIECEEVP